MKNKEGHDYYPNHRHCPSYTENKKSNLFPDNTHSITTPNQNDYQHHSTNKTPLIYKKNVIKSNTKPQISKKPPIFKKTPNNYSANESEVNTTVETSRLPLESERGRKLKMNMAVPPNLSRCTSSSNIKTKHKDDSPTINIEDLLLFEEKYNEIILMLEHVNDCSNECFEWWNYYFTSSLFNNFEHFFKEEESKIVIRSALNLKLLFIIILYDISFDETFYQEANDHLKSIMNLIYKTFLLICEYILSKVSSTALGNLWVGKLNKLVIEKMEHDNSREYDLFLKNCFNTNASINEIRFFATQISKFMRVILTNYSDSLLITDFVQLFKTISNISVNDLNTFFRSKVLRVQNPNSSILGSLLPEEFTKNHIQVPFPYLKKESLKDYTLVLDLDETLINIKVDPQNESKAILRFRPGINDFLECVSKLYEIVVFTAGTKDYADPILDAIEQDKIYFDYRLYRNHAIVYQNDFVKDITKLGRDMSKVIIVDNMQQNFRLQKANGILIKAFWGEDIYDFALFDLAEILQKIALEKLDVRKGIMKYKNDILNKVSSNILRNKH